MIFRRDALRAWAKTKGINTDLFQTEEEWELLDSLAELTCALKKEGLGQDAQS